MTENNLIENLSLNELRVYCNKIVVENSDLKKQIIQMNKLFNLLNANEILSVFNVIKNNANYGISLLNNYNSIKVNDNQFIEEKLESDSSLFQESNEEMFDDKNSVIIPDEFLEQNLEEYESNDSFNLNESQKTKQTKTNDNSCEERVLKTVTIGDRVFECQPSEDGVYRCEWTDCKRTFSQKGNIMRHYTTHGAEKEHKCPNDNCGRAFADKSFVCDSSSCKFRSNSFSALRDHKKLHSDERPYACDWTDCNLRFLTSSHLNDHMRTHTGEKPYACDWPGCQFRASKKNTLTKHKRTHTGEKPYVCDWNDCTFRTTTSYNLTLHKRKHSTQNIYKTNCSTIVRNKRFKR